MIKTTQENLNNCLKQNVLLEHILETERLEKSLIKMELDTLTSVINKCNNRNNNSSEIDVSTLINDRNYLTKKLFTIQASILF